MVKKVVEYINSKLEQLGYFEKIYSLSEIITKGDKTFPAQYLGKGEYIHITNFDKYNGLSYIRKDGDIDISEEEDLLKACVDSYTVSIPLKLITVIKREKLSSDNNYSEDLFAADIIKLLNGKHSDLRLSLKAKTLNIIISSYSNDSLSIMQQEYSNIQKKDINHKYSYMSFDISASMTIRKECINALCEDYGYCNS